MYNYTEHIVRIGSLKAGDTIEFEGNHQTVCSKDLSHCSFMGHSVFGSTYIHGRKTVKKINIINGIVTK